MSPEKRKKVLAITLAVLAALMGLRFLLPDLSSGGAGPTETLSRRGRDGAGTDLPPLAELNLAALEKKSGEFKIGRDPFRFHVPPPPPPPPAPQRQAPPPAPTQRPQPARRQGPQPPPVDVTFLGSFGPNRTRIAVFTDGDDLYNARIGDVVKTHFVVDTIGYESVDLKFVNFPDVPAERLAAGG